MVTAKKNHSPEKNPCLLLVTTPLPPNLMSKGSLQIKMYIIPKVGINIGYHMAYTETQFNEIEQILIHNISREMYPEQHYCAYTIIPNVPLIPFLITELHKIIWPFHASRETQNKISRSQKSQSSNSLGRKLDLHQESRITEKKFSITRHGKSTGNPVRPAKLHAFAVKVPHFTSTSRRNFPWAIHFL